MVSDSEHWDGVFSTENDQLLGWYEHDVSQTLKFLQALDLSAEHRLFLAGAGTSSLVDELLKTGCYLILNDISARALEALQNRIGPANYQLLQHDLSLPLAQVQPVDIWVDRAVLHFLLDELAIRQYFDTLKSSIKLGGHVLLAEFAKGGSEKCAGLPVRQYTVAEMQERLGDGFTLLDTEEYLFVSPAGQERPYVYALFKRQTG